MILEEAFDRRSGLASTINVTCSECDACNVLETSRRTSGNIFEVNERFVYALRTCGKGLASGRTMCAVLNLPPPPTKFASYNARLLDASTTTVRNSMAKAAEELKKEAFYSDGDLETAVTGDVTFSEGWLSQFKERHGVLFSEMCGERYSVDQSVVSEKTMKTMPLPLPALSHKRHVCQLCGPKIQEAFGAEDFADFVSFDDDVVDNEGLTDDKIVAQVRNCSDPQSEEDSSEEAEAPVKLTSSQALEHIEALKERIATFPKDPSPKRHVQSLAIGLGQKQGCSVLKEASEVLAVDPEPCLEHRPVKFRRPALPPCAGATAHFAGAISRFALCFADCRVGACPPDEVTCLQCPNRSPYSPSRLVTSLLPCTAMPLVNWNEATPEDLAGFTADYLREELACRNLDATGPKEEVINRLIADIAQNRSATPTSPDSAASTQRPDTAPPPPSSDAAQTTELLTGLLQQLLHVSQRAAVPVQVTTLPDLSASLPTYSGDGGISASHWIEELEQTQNLASWQPSTLLAVAMGKLRGAAADWKAVIAVNARRGKRSGKRS
ncbi:hypothetical protein HPB48_006245 [Haemaphysalis longicornis]|uniref:Mutator-like transposase domain-containing protein n=1 Tax=Haemaphysalis longicornis TaxID=44386 RepID=A0A9J6GGB5_HAELO|nr:hypothetical protein HPB48_006245 [Haemaphysalis longicornis]